MKFKITKYKHGEERTIEKFAIFPILIEYDDVKEWRWLEKVKIKQKFNVHITAFSSTIDDLKINIFGGFWENIKFIEKSKDEIRNDKLKNLGIKS